MVRLQREFAQLGLEDRALRPAETIMREPLTMDAIERQWRRQNVTAIEARR
jgi:hypothetical protein